MIACAAASPGRSSDRVVQRRHVRQGGSPRPPAFRPARGAHRHGTELPRRREQHRRVQLLRRAASSCARRCGAELERRRPGPRGSGASTCTVAPCASATCATMCAEAPNPDRSRRARAPAAAAPPASAPRPGDPGRPRQRHRHRSKPIVAAAWPTSATAPTTTAAPSPSTPVPTAPGSPGASPSADRRRDRVLHGERGQARCRHPAARRRLPGRRDRPGRPDGLECPRRRVRRTRSPTPGASPSSRPHASTVVDDPTRPYRRDPLSGSPAGCSASDTGGVSGAGPALRTACHAGPTPLPAGDPCEERGQHRSKRRHSMDRTAELIIAVERALRAPSVHNTQPWRWRVDDDAVQLHADWTRHLVATDPDRRDLVLSCGAALHHLLVALAARGLEADVDRLPDPDDTGHLATVTLRRRCRSARGPGAAAGDRPPPHRPAPDEPPTRAPRTPPAPGRARTPRGCGPHPRHRPCDAAATRGGTRRRRNTPGLDSRLPHRARAVDPPVRRRTRRRTGRQHRTAPGRRGDRRTAAAVPPGATRPATAGARTGSRGRRIGTAGDQHGRRRRRRPTPGGRGDQRRPAGRHDSRARLDAAEPGRRGRRHPPRAAARRPAHPRAAPDRAADRLARNPGGGESPRRHGATSGRYCSRGERSEGPVGAF